MIKLEALDGLKLVTDESAFCTDEQTLDRLELAIQQGAGGWGVRVDDGVILRLARDLKITLALAESADEAQRALKGLQMENGRLKKSRDNAKEAAESLSKRVAELEESRGLYED